MKKRSPIRVSKRISEIGIASIILGMLSGLPSIKAQDAPQKSGLQEGGSRKSLKIKLTSVLVDDQEKALKFYTEVLGFMKKRDIPVGKAKWLTVVSPDEPEGTELLLEPGDNPAAKIFKKALFEQGIPFAAFAIEDVQKEYERLRGLGVVFTVKPTNTGPATIAIFDDTCGNLIQIYHASVR
jgi:catechol 2,3-dioxygenase-like lactoylglutathione lyase family enzyme